MELSDIEKAAFLYLCQSVTIQSFSCPKSCVLMHKIAIAGNEILATFAQNLRAVVFDGRARSIALINSQMTSKTK